jgi:adenylate cyclase
LVCEERHLRYFPNLGYGTERYPEKVARRLRAVNIATWLFATSGALFVIKRPWDPDLITLTIGICAALLPLLHRFGPLAAPLALLALYYVQASRIILDVGTGDGIYTGFVTAAPLSILIFGLERAGLAAVLTFIGAALATVLNAVVPHSTGVLSPQALSINFALNFAVQTAISFSVVLYMARQTARAEAAAEREHQRSEALLRNILPPKIAERLKDRAGAEIADAYPEASVLFIDMAGFTSLADATTPDKLVQFLNGVYMRFDALVERYGLEKIKTTGDAYMVVGGVPEPLVDHAALLADFALDVRDTMIGIVDPLGRPMPVRIGIASGPVVAGVVGRRKFFYDVWGDAVNTASRMESTGEVGRIQVSPATHQLLAGRFEFVERGIVEVRGKGPMQTWFLTGRIVKNIAI